MKNILKIYSLIGIWLIINTLLLGFAIHTNSEQPIFFEKFNDYFIIGYKYRLLLYNNENKLLWEKQYQYPINDYDVFGNNIYLLIYNKISVLSLDSKEIKNIQLNDYYNLFSINSSNIFLYKNSTLYIVNKDTPDIVQQYFVFNNIIDLLRDLKDNIYIIQKNHIYKINNMDTINIFNCKNDILHTVFNNDLFVSQKDHILHFKNDSLINIFKLSINSPFIIENDTVFFINQYSIIREKIK